MMTPYQNNCKTLLHFSISPFILSPSMQCSCWIHLSVYSKPQHANIDKLDTEHLIPRRDLGSQSLIHLEHHIVSQSQQQNYILTRLWFKLNCLKMMSLVTLFGGLKSLFKVKAYIKRAIIHFLSIKVRQYSADNFIFRLHYKVQSEIFS